MRRALLSCATTLLAVLAVASCGFAPAMPEAVAPPVVAPAGTVPPPAPVVPTSDAVAATTAAAGTAPTAGTPADPASRAPAGRPAAVERPAAAVVEPTGETLSTFVTYYAAYDNDPPGTRAIAYPNARHPEAGGTGTFDDPLTLATDPRELAVGTVVYYPAVRKYFVMEDLCAACVQDWDDARTFHIDLWSGAATDSGVTACQEALTPDGRVTVELDPPPGRAVDTAPFYEDGVCLAG